MEPADASAGPPDATGAGALLVAQICTTCVQTLPIAGAAVSVMTAGGHRGVVCATDAAARALEDIQFTVGEGPGNDAFASGHAVLVPDLSASPSAWVALADVARDYGTRAMFSFPLHLGAASLGALTLHAVHPGSLTGEDLAQAVRLADSAAFAVLDLIVGTEMRNANAVDGTGSGGPELFRIEVYQAAGMVMIQLGVPIEDAMVRLRSHAFVTGEPIGDIAGAIVRRELRLEADDVGSAENG